jgi:hypothetical protein
MSTRRISHADLEAFLDERATGWPDHALRDRIRTRARAIRQVSPHPWSRVSMPWRLPHGAVAATIAAIFCLSASFGSPGSGVPSGEGPSSATGVIVGANVGVVDEAETELDDRDDDRGDEVRDDADEPGRDQDGDGDEPDDDLDEDGAVDLDDLGSDGEAVTDHDERNEHGAEADHVLGAGT